MVLSRTSLPVRYYAFLLRAAGNERYEVEDRLSRTSDLCQFARAIIFRSLAMLIALAVLLFVATGAVLVAYNDPMSLVVALGIFIAVLGATVGCTVGVMKFREYLREIPENSGNVAVVYLRAVKRGICPMLKIEQR